MEGKQEDRADAFIVNKLGTIETIRTIDSRVLRRDREVRFAGV